MYSKKSEKRKKKKKMKKKPKKRIDKQITRIPGMFPSPIIGSNSIIYQPPQMTREDPVAQINIRNTEAVRNRLLLENGTDLVAPQRRLETLVAPEQPSVAPSKPKMVIQEIPPHRQKPNRSSSLPPTPTAGYFTGEKISLLPNQGEEIKISENITLRGDDIILRRKKKKTRSGARSPTKRRP